MSNCFKKNCLRQNKCNNLKGFSLIEIILVVLAIGFIVTLMANLPNALGLITKSKHISLAKEIAMKQIEDKRSTLYANIVNGESPILDARLSKLPEGTGTVKIEDCSLQICTNSEPVKHIKVKVTWKDNLKDQEIMLETFIGEGGLNQ